MSRIMGGTHKIEYVNGHYEVKDKCGKFVLSGDTYEECYNDLEDMLVAGANVKIRMENIKGVVA